MITEQILYNTAKSYNREILGLLVNNFNSSHLNLPITERTLKCVAKNTRHSRALMGYLFDLQVHNLLFLENTFISITEIPRAGSVLWFILKRWPETPVSNRLFEAVCCHPDALGLLLGRQRDCSTIIAMLYNVITNPERTGRVLKLIYKQNSDLFFSDTRDSRQHGKRRLFDEHSTSQTKKWSLNLGRGNQSFVDGDNASRRGEEGLILLCEAILKN